MGKQTDSQWSRVIITTRAEKDLGLRIPDYKQEIRVPRTANPEHEPYEKVLQ